MDADILLYVHASGFVKLVVICCLRGIVTVFMLSFIGIINLWLNEHWSLMLLHLPDSILVLSCADWKYHSSGLHSVYLMRVVAVIVPVIKDD